MVAEVESPKVTNPSPPPLFHPPSLSSLPDDIVLNILARISISQYRSLSLVSKSFNSLLSSPEIYTVRSQIGNQEPRLYVCLRSRQPGATHHRWFNLQTLTSNNEEIKGDELSLNFSSSYYPARFNSTTVAIGNEIYQFGGSNKKKLSRVVRVLDCRSHKRRRAPYMTVPRKRAKSCFLDGKIYVVGGCRKTEKPMNWGEVFDIKTQIWKPLPSPSDNIIHLKHRELVFGGKLYIITEHNSYYAYDPKEGSWNTTLDKLCLSRRIGFFHPVIGRRRIRRLCVIENVIFAAFRNSYSNAYYWYNSDTSYWCVVKGLEDLNRKCPPDDCCTVQLVNYGGKVVIIWHGRLVTAKHGKIMGISCAVIRLEKRLREIWGEIEKFSVVSTVPESHKLWSSGSVSL